MDEKRWTIVTGEDVYVKWNSVFSPPYALSRCDAYRDVGSRKRQEQVFEATVAQKLQGELETDECPVDIHPNERVYKDVYTGSLRNAG